MKNEILRRARGDRPLRHVAEEADVSPAHLSQIERGIGNPSLAVLRRLADALHLRPSEIVGLVRGHDESSDSH